MTRGSRWYPFRRYKCWPKRPCQQPQIVLSLSLTGVRANIEPAGRRRQPPLPLWQWEPHIIATTDKSKSYCLDVSWWHKHSDIHFVLLSQFYRTLLAKPFADLFKRASDDLMSCQWQNTEPWPLIRASIIWSWLNYTDLMSSIEAKSILIFTHFHQQWLKIKNDTISGRRQPKSDTYKFQTLVIS